MIIDIHRMKKNALILGATGLVGEECLRLLLQDQNYSNVKALVRRPLSIHHHKLQVIIADFEKLHSISQEINADDVFCCIGTTIGKAGSQQAFRKVDFDIPLQTATLALLNGAQQFILCSSIGADAASSVFYSRVKGELENEVSKLGYKSVIIFRPSILLGDRKEQRTGEAIGRFVAEKFSFLFAGPLKKYAGAPITILAKKMVELANAGNKGIRIFENEEIIQA